jgi:serine/threonine protein phosphatase PrpC
MSEEQDRKVTVKVFDRYTRQTVLSGEHTATITKDKGDHSPNTLSASSLNYKDEIPSEVNLKVRSVQESLREGLVLITESDQLQEHLSSIPDLDDSLNGTLNDQGTMLDETEDIATHDLFEVTQWEVWISAHIPNDIATKSSQSLFAIRENRVQTWNKILPHKVMFKTLSKIEHQTELKVDPYSVDTLSLLDNENPLSLDMDDEEENDQAKQANYQLGKLPINLSTLTITRLSELSPELHTREQGVDGDEAVVDANSRGKSRYASKVVRTVPHKYIDHVVSTALPLLRLVESLHIKDLCLGGFDPSLFGQLEDDPNAVRPIYPLPVYNLKTESYTPRLSGEEMVLHTGFSPPEMYGYFNAQPSKRSDVFSAGMLLYYAFTDCNRFAETRRPFFRLPSPFVYRQDLSPELVAVIYRAISPEPRRRQPDMVTLINDIEWALDSSLQRESPNIPPLCLEAGQEIHIGLLKGQYNPINQDDLFLGYQAELDLGLFVVTDGVSICEYGSGDLASGFVREAAVESWRDLCQVQTLTEEEDTLSEVSLGMIEGLTGNYGKFLKQLVNDSNRRIGQYVNQQMPSFHGPAEGIMAATVVAAVVNQGNATLTSVGDSRIYLIRNGYIISIMYDEDLYTHLLQAQQSPTQAQQSPSSSALVHCIGEFTKNADQQLIPSKINPQLRELRLLPGDCLLLCSDGLPDYSGTDEGDAEERMRQCIEDGFNVHHAAFELISLANRGGGGDNLSCIVLKFVADQVNLDEDKA